MIGLSVSFCIKEIAAGRVALADVEKIVEGSNCSNSDQWEREIKMYRDHYWQENPDECERIFRQLLAENKIYQPFPNGKRIPFLNGSTKWVNSESEFRYPPSW